MQLKALAWPRGWRRGVVGASWKRPGAASGLGALWRLVWVAGKELELSYHNMDMW